MSAFVENPIAKHQADYYEKELHEVYRFIELTEAFTTDKRTADRIRLFLEEKGVWEKPKKNEDESTST